MLRSCKSILMLTCIVSLLFLVLSPYTADAAKVDKKEKAEKAIPGSMTEKVAKANAEFNATKMSDMSDFDPGTWVSPTGDTIKIAIVAAFSGPGAINGQYYWGCMSWVAHDINKRGGIFVDGKKKLIEVIKADHMGKPDQTKKICERMALQDKVHVFMGTNSSHLMKIMNETANKYNIISMNFASMADDLQDATNFNRHAFMPTISGEQAGRGLAYYYGQIKKKEKKFYILCQDYSYGHELADGFKKGLKEYYPEAQIVGEDYHKLFLMDFAPYLEKIKASGAEVIFSSDWDPDCRTLIKQARQMKVMLPFAHNYMDLPEALQEIGIAGSKGLVGISAYDTENPQFKTPGHIKISKAWHDQWKRWKTVPFNSAFFEYHASYMGSWVQNMYWLVSVIERAKSTDADKIIGIWENDTYKTANGKIQKMRACDHKAIQDLAVSEFVPPEQQKVSFNIPPYYWYKDSSSHGPTFVIPADKILPKMDQNLDRCKGKNGWGE